MAYNSELDMIEHRDRIESGIKEILNDYANDPLGAVNALTGEIQNNYIDGFFKGVERAKQAINEIVT